MKRVLIVEDEAIVAADLRQTLQEIGYQVPAVAGSGEEAVRQALATEPDLVLMDIRLDGDLDGIDAACRIQAQRDIPVVFLTAYTDDRTIGRAGRADAYGYLVKPFEPRELRATVETAIARHRRRSEERSAADFLAILLDSLDVGVVAENRQGNIALMNKAAEALTGWTLEEARGKRTEAVLAFAGSWKRPQPGETVERGTAALTTRTGKQTLVEQSSTPLRGAAGKMNGRVFLISGNAREREHDAERRRIGQLNAMRDFATGLAHDFNNLLTVIAGYVEFVLSAADSPEIVRPAEEIRRAADQAAALTRRLMTTARLPQEPPVVIDPNAVITSIEPLFREALGPDIRFRCAVSPGVPEIRAVMSDFEDVLVTMASYFRGVLPAGSDLLLHTSAMEVNEEAAARNPDLLPGRYALITLTDAVAAPSQPRIQTASNALGAPGAGTGLTLAGLFVMVRQMRGHLWIQRESTSANVTLLLFPACSGKA